MNHHLMPFGYGARVCGGQGMALIMLKLSIASIIRNFEVSAPAETNAVSMAIKDSFVSVYSD